MLVELRFKWRDVNLNKQASRHSHTHLLAGCVRMQRVKQAAGQRGLVKRLVKKPLETVAVSARKLFMVVNNMWLRRI
jgi:hypothetical protein